MLMPKKVKYRKQQRGRMTGKAWRGSTLAFGDFGLKVLEPGWITDRQIEASRVAMTRFVKRGGKIWIRVFPDKPVTKKPAETRMGKGKGAPDHWVAVVRPGKILFWLEGVAPGDAREGWGRGGAQRAQGDKKLRGLKKDVARIKTITRERELGLNAAMHGQVEEAPVKTKKTAAKRSKKS